MHPTVCWTWLEVWTVNCKKNLAAKLEQNSAKCRAHLSKSEGQENSGEFLIDLTLDNADKNCMIPQPFGKQILIYIHRIIFIILLLYSYCLQYRSND